MPIFVKVASTFDLKPGSAMTVTANGTEIALYNVAGKIYATNNTCLHQGGPLGEGQLEGNVVTCPWHGWQFNVTTGKAVMNPNAGVACYRAEVRDDGIYIDTA